jgi:transcriptional regulator with XRE-family HTH domain
MPVIKKKAVLEKKRATYSLLDEMMTDTEKNFYLELGGRIAELRKIQQLTQIQLANLLDVNQQVIASYEIGRRKVPASMIPKLAKVLAVSVEEMLGVSPRPAKRGPTSKLQKQVEQISLLPRSKQKFIIEMLDALIEQQRKAG